MSVVIITGMHRSGTSLVSSYLQACGLDIGSNLIGSKKGNIKGHFEDEDFVNFHKQIIHKSKQNMFLPRDITISENEMKLAKRLYESKKKSTLWGWKDPRTVVFLDFWNKVIDDQIRYIFIYRHPRQVVDSLLRRGTDSILRYNPLVAAKSWIIYNEMIINFIKSNRVNFFLLNIKEFIHNTKLLVDFINYGEIKKILHENIRTIFEENMITSNVMLSRSKFVNFIYNDKFNSLYKKLESLKNSYEGNIR